jgi:hypothetical protein
VRRLILAIMVIVTAVSCGAALPSRTIALGTPFVDAGLTMTVQGADLVQPISDDYPWGRWLVVDVDVSAGDATTSFNATNQQLFIDGRECFPDPAAAETYSERTASGAALLPHERAAITLAFNVSRTEYTTASKVELVIRGDVDSPGVLVPLPGSVLAWPPTPERSSP